MLTFMLKPSNDHPLYNQLYQFIKDEIQNRNLKTGEKLPSKRKLSTHLKVSQNTVETAYEQLKAEGYITSIPKSGYYVSELDNEFVPPVHRSQPRINIKTHKTSHQYRYDFKTNKVDTTFFPFATWTRISREIMHDENRELLKASHPQGDYNLRAQIAKHIHQYRGVNCLPEQIIIGAGTEYLLSLLIQILGKNCSYAVENPGYLKTFKILNSHGVKVNAISLDDGGISMSTLSASDSNIAYITPSHHFPLGTIMPIARRTQLLKWANRVSDRYIIEDDYDSEFRFIGRPIPALQGLDGNCKVIYMSTFSKSIAPSIRISYMVLPPNLLERYVKDFQFYSSTVPRFEQYTLFKFIKDGHFERHLNRMRNIYRARKDKLVDEIRKLTYSNKIEIIGENAGLHLLIRINSSVGENELIARAEKEGVKLYGLSEFFIKPIKIMPESTVILGYSHLNLHEIEEAIRLLSIAWSDLSHT